MNEIIYATKASFSFLVKTQLLGVLIGFFLAQIPVFIRYHKRKNNTINLLLNEIKENYIILNRAVPPPLANGQKSGEVKVDIGIILDMNNALSSKIYDATLVNLAEIKGDLLEGIVKTYSCIRQLNRHASRLLYASKEERLKNVQLNFIVYQSLVWAHSQVEEALKSLPGGTKIVDEDKVNRGRFVITKNS